MADSFDERIERIRDLPVYRVRPNALGWVSAEAIAEIVNLAGPTREDAVRDRATAYSNEAHRARLQGGE